MPDDPRGAAREGIHLLQTSQSRLASTFPAEVPILKHRTHCVRSSGAVRFDIDVQCSDQRSGQRSGKGIIGIRDPQGWLVDESGFSGTERHGCILLLRPGKQ
ncbi:hypothetical protein [Azospirillum aestuarii]|uniref:hypothetical protein n=1 Tax=Azospirillum aestuarii TaxID=2802052 RepID=UPI004054B994